MDGGLDIDIRQEGARSVVRLRGDIDGKTSLQIRSLILDLFEKGGQEGVVVDLKGVTHIDSSGAASLLTGFEAAETRNAMFLLTGLN